MTRVVLLGLDGFPPRAIRRDLTPRMWALAQEGGWSPQGGITALPSSTDPGFCTLLTGQMPEVHQVRTTAWRFADLPTWAGRATPAIPTLFDLLRLAGIPSAAVVGDDRGLLCIASASQRWPPTDAVPEGAPLDAHGYPSNAAVRPHLLEAIDNSSVPFVFGHLNDADTAGHDFGPESEAALSCYHATDKLVGEVLDHLRPGWSETVVIIVSDHDMETRRPTAPIKLAAHPASAEVLDGVIPDGGAALVHLRPGVTHDQAGAVLREVNGVDTWIAGGPELLIAGAQPGRFFKAPVHYPGGFHGGPATAQTVAIVGGGHPRAMEIAKGVSDHRPHLADWAGMILKLLGADGASNKVGDQAGRVF